MKKITRLLLSMMMLLSLVACAKDQPDGQEVDEKPNSSEVSNNQNTEEENVIKDHSKALVLKDIDGVMTFEGENLLMEVVDESTLSITVSALDFKDTYIRNLDGSEVGYCEYSWSIEIDGLETYLVSTAIWAEEPGKKNEILLDEMDTTLAIASSKEFKVLEDAEVKMTHDASSITWLVTFPEGANFDYKAIQNVSVMVYDSNEGINLTTDYKVK